MRRGIVLGVLVSLAAESVWGAGMSLESYVQVSIERLQLTEDAWKNTSRPPTEDQLEALWKKHGTTAEEYLGYAADHRSEVEAFLEAHPETRAEIEGSSRRINELIREAEPQ